MAAICYAWVLSIKADGRAGAAVPVVNMQRSRMARCRQAAWLLYHVGVDASALLFADEVSYACYETMMSGVDGDLGFGRGPLPTNRTTV